MCAKKSLISLHIFLVVVVLVVSGWVVSGTVL